MKVSIVIVSYNVKHYLEQCLDSLFKALAGLESEVFVVDNASSDGSAEMVQCRYPQAACIANGDNVGFSKANNQALALSTGEYILLLNPDTLVSRESIRDCVEYLESHDDAGSVTVKMISASGAFQIESKRGFPSPQAAFFKLFGLSRMFPKSKLFGAYNLLYLDEDETHRIDILCGAFIMFRKSLMDKVGMLDPAFFMYGEDIDFSYRLTNKTGYANYYLPCPILHYKGESTKKGSIAHVSSFYGSMLVFYEKYYSSAKHWFRAFVKAGVYLHAFCYYILRHARRLMRKKAHDSTGLEGKRFIAISVNDADASVLSTMASRFGCSLAGVMKYEDALQQLAGIDCDYIVFCRETISYDDVISFMNKCKGKGAELGIYSRELKTLVLPENILRLDDGKNI